MNREVIVKSEDETLKLASSIGENLRGGECIEFVSDLGGGKTAFVRGIVSGAGSRDLVGSPTFTISKRYKNDKLSFYHYDFYRLAEPGLVAEELAESLEDSKVVTLIEWAKSVDHVLPESRLVIHIEKTADNPEGRRYIITYPEELDYLLSEVKP